jgi:hypothetical protein
MSAFSVSLPFSSSLEVTRKGYPLFTQSRNSRPPKIGVSVWPMNYSVAITCVLIVLARITDVTLDTLRTAAIVQGRRVFAAGLGFFQAVIYVFAIAKVLLNMDHLSYGLPTELVLRWGRISGSLSSNISPSVTNWHPSSQEKELS